MLHCFAFFAAFALFKIICVRAWICWNSCAAFSPSEINPSNTFCKSDSLFSNTEVLTSCCRGLPWIGDIIVSVKKMLSGFSRSIVYVTCEKQGADNRSSKKVLAVFFIRLWMLRLGLRFPGTTSRPFPTPYEKWYLDLWPIRNPLLYRLARIRGRDRFASSVMPVTIGPSATVIIVLSFESLPNMCQARACRCI